MQRVDLFPTHEYKGLKLRTGRPYPFGATVMGNAVNFSVYSRYATACTLVLFHNHEPEPFIEIPFLKEFKMGNVFSMMVFDLDFEDIEYGYRMDGPWNPQEGHSGANSRTGTTCINTEPVWFATTLTGKTTSPWKPR